MIMFSAKIELGFEGGEAFTKGTIDVARGCAYCGIPRIDIGVVVWEA